MAALEIHFHLAVNVRVLLPVVVVLEEEVLLLQVEEAEIRDTRRLLGMCPLSLEH